MAFVKKDKSGVIEKQMIFTTEIVNDATNKLNDGVILKRFENPWMNSEVGLRRDNITFMMTEDEQVEYIKCAMDIHYFTEKYCKVKTEDGSINNIKLRDYQNEILDNFVNNRFNILMCSRQMGKTISASIFIIHTILFKNDKNVMIVANKGDTTIEIVDKIKGIYTQLPFFLKPGIKIWNQKSLTFENGCRVKTSARSKTVSVGFSIDLLYMDEFAHIPSTIIEPYYTAAYPTVSGIDNSKIIITSTPNGMNLFHKLLTDAERPDGDPLKNNYKPLRVYWYQAKGRF
ncbi:MAG: terminase family protein, partial [Candidatus Muirbacterium halophilum]|nr:terminase family protein [Candidatus Muirbacterium halophilum]